MAQTSRSYENVASVTQSARRAWATVNKKPAVAEAAGPQAEKLSVI
jgi:hypothetical protein